MVRGAFEDETSRSLESGVSAAPTLKLGPGNTERAVTLITPSSMTWQHAEAYCSVALLKFLGDIREDFAQSMLLLVHSMQSSRDGTVHHLLIEPSPFHRTFDCSHS